MTALNFSPTLTDNRVLVAVSSGAPISNATIWTFWYFEHDLDFPTGDTGRFFDVGTLGVDANALLVGGNLFDDTGAYQGTSVHVLRKSEVVSGPGGDLAAGGKITFSAPGAWPPTAISANTVLARRRPCRRRHPLCREREGARRLDDRLFDAQLRDGHLWTAHNIAVDATGAGSDSGDRDGARWYEIDVTGGSPSVVQSGTLFDAAASNPRSYWIPSTKVPGPGLHGRASAAVAARSGRARRGRHGEAASGGRVLRGG